MIQPGRDKPAAISEQGSSDMVKSQPSGWLILFPLPGCLTTPPVRPSVNQLVEGRNPWPLIIANLPTDIRTHIKEGLTIPTCSRIDRRMQTRSTATARNDTLLYCCRGLAADGTHGAGRDSRRWALSDDAGRLCCFNSRESLGRPRAMRFSAWCGSFQNSRTTVLPRPIFFVGWIEAGISWAPKRFPGHYAASR